MARDVSEGFTVFLSRLTPTSAERTAGVKHRESVRLALEARLQTYRFIETGSFTHGTGVRGHSDIDALISLAGPRPVASFPVLESVKDALTARFPLTPVKIRRPAVVAQFGGGYQTWEVIPGYLTGRGSAGQFVYDVPSPASNGGWIDSAPEVHLDYVNECNRSPARGDAKALARLVKAWKYYRNVPISSFYLEMRCAQHIHSVSTYIHIWDLCELLESLERHQLASMNDPRRAAGRIEACSTDAKRTDALTKLRRAARRSRKSA
jgi:hypothetical protein